MWWLCLDSSPSQLILHYKWWVYDYRLPKHFMYIWQLVSPLQESCANGLLKSNLLILFSDMEMCCKLMLQIELIKFWSSLCMLSYNTVGMRTSHVLMKPIQNQWTKSSEHFFLLCGGWGESFIELCINSFNLNIKRDAKLECVVRLYYIVKSKFSSGVYYTQDELTVE